MRENFYGGEPPIFETIYVISPTASIDRSSQPFHRKELEDRIIILVYIHDDMSSIDLLWLAQKLKIFLEISSISYTAKADLRSTIKI